MVYQGEGIQWSRNGTGTPAQVYAWPYSIFLSMYLPANLPYGVSIYLSTNYQSRPIDYSLASLTICCHCYLIILRETNTHGEQTLWKVDGAGSSARQRRRKIIYINHLIFQPTCSLSFYIAPLRHSQAWQVLLYFLQTILISLGVEKEEFSEDTSRTESNSVTLERELDEEHLKGQFTRYLSFDISPNVHKKDPDLKTKNTQIPPTQVSFWRIKIGRKVNSFMFHVLQTPFIKI